MNAFVNETVKSIMGSFEKKRKNYIDEYEVYGTTVKKKLYLTDDKERYIHVYHSVQKESAERTQLESNLRQINRFIKKHTNEIRQFGSGIEKYFILHYNEKTNQFQFGEEKISVIEEE